ncbi:MAG: S8 family serine peptidase [Minicystis sp.]
MPARIEGRGTPHAAHALHTPRARRALTGLLLAGLATAGCQSTPRDADPETIGAAQSAFTFQCGAGWRWVAEVPAGPPDRCTDVSNWHATPILGDVLGGNAPRYCAFEWTENNAPVLTDVSVDLVNHLGGQWPTEDCTTVGSLAAPVAEYTSAESELKAIVPPPYPLADFGQDLRRELRHNFAARSGGVPLPDGAGTADSPIRVRVAVIDAEPDSNRERAQHPGFVPHGAVVRGLIRNLTCPGWSEPGGPPGACLTTTITKLALPHRDHLEKPDWDRGGEYGTIGELATAISAAVDAWRTDGKNTDDPTRLVINLSVGVQPGKVACAGDPTSSSALLLDRVLHDALRKAACHGAIVVTAAGNAPSDVYDPGATCPAAWSHLPAPSAAECLDRFGIDATSPPFADWPSAGASAPLVYAVHGVDASDHPVTNARAGARGWIAADGLLAVSSDLPVAGHAALPSPYTGSSVAAAAVSGIAAAVWAYRPELSGREVMNLIHETGFPLPEYATLCPPSTGEFDSIIKALQEKYAEAPGTAPAGEGQCSARRASLCDALALACAGSSRCPALPGCPSKALIDAQNDPPSPNLAFAFALLDDSALPGSVTPLFLAPMSPGWPDPWVHPQPTNPPCGPACGFDLSRSLLLLSIDPEYRAPIQRISLVLTDGGSNVAAFDLGQGFYPDRLYSFTLDGDIGWTTTATLSFQLDDRTTIREQIYVRR